ncbi:MAG: alpha/beta fold hydrolase, partial [Candidatus Dormibacter sp.]|uniref:alpha/beta hydrolase n=1 Tax=Candidatus Dormibacter sp. TaxID=2973982 RepID=UPI003D9BFCEA
MRAREPAVSDFVEGGGVRVGYEVFGEGEPAILLLPGWSIMTSRQWKGQVPHLARRFRVVTFDARGSGRSDRPAHPAAYLDRELAADALAVLDAAQVDAALVVGLSRGARHGLQLAALAQPRVAGLVLVSPAMRGLGAPHPTRTVHSFADELATEEGWAKYNLPYWRRDFRGFLEFFFGEALPEPHSTKQLEDAVGWGLETTPEVVAMCDAGNEIADTAAAEDLTRAVRCPVLVVNGSDDRITPPAWGARLAELTGGSWVVLEGSGHFPTARHPVRLNLLIRDFATRLMPSAPAPSAWTRAAVRRRRALFISSPIGLGHVRRDLAIAAELRRLHPDLEIDWLAQPPVTGVLEAAGERVHPASSELASEVAHIDAQAAEHELAVFDAFRRMDEILLANFMLFLDVVRETAYDLWIGDEAWEVDHFLHENPELKTAAYAWLTDFVGWLPLPEGGEREAELTADYNAEMLEQIERFPRVRDRAIFLGGLADIPDRDFGPGLPGIREWVGRHYQLVPFVPGYDPAGLDREQVRQELGWGSGEPVCVVAVGGSGTGEHLLRRAIAAYPEACRRIPGLRLVCVCGPRIDPARLAAPAGVELLAYVDQLYRWLAASDVALVQGGLGTTMELAAAGRPFVYVPLRHHFEQQVNVHHRLRRHRAGRRLDYEQATPTRLAGALAAELGRPQHPRPIPPSSAPQATKPTTQLTPQRPQNR